MGGERGAEEKPERGQGPPPTPVAPKDKTPNTDAAHGCRERNVNDDPNKFDRDLVRWTKAVAVLTGLLFLGALLQFGAALLQWNAMGEQLKEMKSGGADTSTIAHATSDFAAAMKRQADNTGGIVDQAKRSADASTKSLGQQNFQFRFAQQPHISFGELPEKSSIFAYDPNTGMAGINYTIRNTGNSTVKNAKSVEVVSVLGSHFSGAHTFRSFQDLDKGQQLRSTAIYGHLIGQELYNQAVITRNGIVAEITITYSDSIGSKYTQELCIAAGAGELHLCSFSEFDTVPRDEPGKNK